MRVPRRALLRTTVHAALAGAASLPLAAPFPRRAAADPAARVTLLHLNDFHSRHEPVNAEVNTCRAEDASRGGCLGGSARLATGLRLGRARAAAAGRAVLQVDAGDQFMGSLFYTHYRGDAELAVMRTTGCEVMVPGNHEFDNGPENFARFVRAAPFPILSANIDATAEPSLAGTMRPWMTVERGGARLALVGVTTTTTPSVSSPGPTLRFRNAEEAVSRAIAEIRAADARAGRASTVVVISHRGLEADQRLAAHVAGVDVIVGGHSHTLLSNSVARAEGPSPVLADGPDRPVRIVQAGAYGRYLGHLELDLGPDGRVLAHGGDTTALTQDIPPDPEVAALVATLAVPLQETLRRRVSRAAAPIGNGNCRTGECALGNLIADAMLAALPVAEVAIHNGGGLRAGLPAGEVTLGDLLTVMPFGNTLSLLRLRGADLRAALEHGLRRAPEPSGAFPQVAGMRLRWNPAAPPGQRVEEVQVMLDGRLAPLDPERAYVVVTHSFLRSGGDGYAVLRDRTLEGYATGPLLTDAVVPYLQAHAPLAPRRDGRIAAVG
ncbi:5'-nucleotidase C-terminal domain-containing protein [Roseomonas sp. NAR14]|uniref:5'-nucleotidase C-terminal domain-containing protein n=1 Tax=Roseomonas acroporae TaxID=2937791 RepID=A0A9X1YBQ0_9PROT|nr:5'-nucleotidase C-terminal domain-containing protein [Roseomonas acroporae]MCK8787176.1 5'-nucleotidase C-terminal domain-containing protein [Roseomonas acroporae]